MKKQIKRYISQKCVEVRFLTPYLCAKWWECVVEYTDGSIETVREVVTENA